MSKYDDAFVFDGHDTFWLDKDNGKLRDALHDIHARIEALEAAQKKPDAPTPEQREPGWYWVKWEADNEWLPVRYYGEHWHLPIPPKIIGPRITEPGQ